MLLPHLMLQETCMAGIRQQCAVLMTTSKSEAICIAAESLPHAGVHHSGILWANACLPCLLQHKCGNNSVPATLATAESFLALAATLSSESGSCAAWSCAGCTCVCMLQGYQTVCRACAGLLALEAALSVSQTLCASATGASAKAAICTRCSILRGGATACAPLTCSGSCCATCRDAAPGRICRVC